MKAKSEPLEQAERVRWGAIVSCAAARALAVVLELTLGGGADGDVPPTQDVVNAFRHAGLSWTKHCDRLWSVIRSV